jgi:hypothetical protein
VWLKKQAWSTLEPKKSNQGEMVQIMTITFDTIGIAHLSRSTPASSPSGHLTRFQKRSKREWRGCILDRSADVEEPYPRIDTIGTTRMDRLIPAFPDLCVCSCPSPHRQSETTATFLTCRPTRTCPYGAMRRVTSPPHEYQRQ